MVVSRSIIFGAKSKIAFAITALTAGAGAAAVATSEDPATSLKLCTTVPLRLFRVSLTAATIAFGGTCPLCPLLISAHGNSSLVCGKVGPASVTNTMLLHRIRHTFRHDIRAPGMVAHTLCQSNVACILDINWHRQWHAYLASTGIANYEYSLLGLPEDSIERARVKHEVHTRSARRLEELCFKNGGIYIKLGQHIGQLEYLVPQEYIKTLRESMLNRCPTSSYDQVCQVVKKELGGEPEEIFDEFDPVPIASASLAQVHVARTHEGQKVAVKVQHMHMTDTAAADYATVEFIINTLHWLFPSFDYRWLVDEVHDSLPKELDFLNEAKNSIKCMDNFRKLSPHIADYVYAPKVYWNLSTTKLLTMEFVEGAEVNDLKSIQKLGINPHDIARLFMSRAVY
ncbi:putative ABC1 protein [Tanacetum coccineum]